MMLVGLIECEQTVTLWGQLYRITPRLVTGRLGDGKQVVAFSPLATRPNYYVVRVDSRWNLDNYAAGDLFVDHTDAVYDLIEEEFGSARCGTCGERFGFGSCEECSGEAEAEGEFPHLDDSCGSSWAAYKKEATVEWEEP